MFSNSRDYLIPLNQQANYLDESYIDVIESENINGTGHVNDDFSIPISKKIKVRCISYFDCCQYGYNSLTYTQKSVIFLFIFVIVLILLVWS